MKCARCDAEGAHDINGYGTLYCDMHNTLRNMLNNARRAGKYCPNIDEVEALVPDPLVCPECDKNMAWRSSDRKQVVSLQHWKDGRLSLICVSCNARMRSHEIITPEGTRRCGVCEEIKPDDHFHHNQRRCKPCHVMKNREYLDRKESN